MDKEFKEERENHVGRMIHMLSHQLKRRGAVPEMETGLTPMQKHILTFILFEKNGFIYRKSVARDARLKQIVPTEKAEKFRMDILMNIKETERRLTEGIPKPDLEVCLKVLRHMLLNLSGEGQIK